MTIAAIAWLVLAQSLMARDSAKIIVYLPWDSLQHSRLKISVDEVSVAEIRPGRFFVINAEPCRHVLGEGIPTVVEASPDRESFVRVARQIELLPSGKTDIPALEVMSAEQARPEVVNLVYVERKKIFSPSVSKEDPFLRQRPKLKTHGSSQ
jgi:hypothetical protein